MQQSRERSALRLLVLHAGLSNHDTWMIMYCNLFRKIVACLLRITVLQLSCTISRIPSSTSWRSCYSTQPLHAGHSKSLKEIGNHIPFSTTAREFDLIALSAHWASVFRISVQDNVLGSDVGFHICGGRIVALGGAPPETWSHPHFPYWLWAVRLCPQFTPNLNPHRLRHGSVRLITLQFNKFLLKSFSNSFIFVRISFRPAC